ncbi:hypothetical protein [Devosia sp. DBB001]|nr:hypothetical protein [Devosia sp. DBB001]
MWRTSSRRKEGPGFRGLSLFWLNPEPMTALRKKRTFGGAIHQPHVIEGG